MKPLGVLQVVLNLRVGGLERVVVDLVEHASAGFRLVICCLEPPSAEAQLPPPARARLVILTACQSAMGAPSLASVLLAAGVPAV
ncbi:hypothetical protein HQ590_07290, partial [bacterium]|nr:hypothetical protein [bacterium]